VGCDVEVLDEDDDDHQDDEDADEPDEPAGHGVSSAWVVMLVPRAAGGGGVHVVTGRGQRRDGGGQRWVLVVLVPELP